MNTQTPLLILHGALGAKDQFEALKKDLSENFEVHTLNFSGHGGLPFAKDFSIDRFKEELKVYIQDNALEGANIFGYSMGGYVTLRLLYEEPNIISKLFTLGTKFDWTPESAAQEVKMLNPEKIEEKVPAFAQALAKRHQPNDWKEVLLRTKDLMLQLGNGSALTLKDFQKIESPVIIGIGDQDNMVSLEESKNVADLLPHGALKIFEGFKHPIEQVNTGQLATALSDYFKN